MSKKEPKVLLRKKFSFSGSLAFVRVIGTSAILAIQCGVAKAQLADSAINRARAALADFSRICASPAADVWRVSLCGPIVLVDPETRAAVTNQLPSSPGFVTNDGVSTGKLPDDIEIANTATMWSGTRWTMLMLPLSSNDRNRTILLAHEAFHRIQPTLGVTAANVVIPQLDERDARYWVRLQLRALRDVQLDSGNIRARAALADALLFAAARHHQYPGTDTLEATLELSEGLAEYTGIVVAAGVFQESAFNAADRARRNLESLPTFVRSYAYGMGPPLGLALDRFAPGWRARIDAIHSLSSELSHAINWSAPSDLMGSARARAAIYDKDSVGAQEDARAAARAEELTMYRARLIDGPVVIFRQTGLGGAFNPNTIVPLGDEGLIYPRRTVSAQWGELTVQRGGLLVSRDRSSARVTATGIRIDEASHTASGDGWTLKLAPEWTLRPGVRAGDYEVTLARK